MSARIYRLPAARPPLLTKKQLAAHLGRSTRWIELQVRRGLPVEAATDRFGARRYDLAKVEAWLHAGEPVARRGSNLADRVAALELVVGELTGGSP
jgi:phage terminase Nu1 subunit (DNA packaging protein)